MYILNILILLTVILQESLSQESKLKPQPTPFEDWDYLVFSQRWSISSCTEWESKKKENTCYLPYNDIWLIHGIWPTKYGKKGPYFCNSALHFDMNQIEPIINDLNHYWTNIENGTKSDSFWKHEWNKHGTCSSILPQLNSVQNFFKMGLKWNNVYNISNMLKENQIIPRQNGYSAQDIYDSIKSVINKEPAINCISYNEQILINEIKICFNKDLVIIDCNSDSKYLEKNIQNCGTKKQSILYLDKVNSSSEEDESLFKDENNITNYIQECMENFEIKQKLLNFYNTIKLLMWITL